jgi:hypothetical protein
MLCTYMNRSAYVLLCTVLLIVVSSYFRIWGISTVNKVRLVYAARHYRRMHIRNPLQDPRLCPATQYDPDPYLFLGLRPCLFCAAPFHHHLASHTSLELFTR